LNCFLKYMRKMVGALGGDGAKVLTRWSRSRTKTDRLRNTIDVISVLESVYALNRSKDSILQFSKTYNSLRRSMPAFSWRYRDKFE
jgi:hypothetical protein